MHILIERNLVDVLSLLASTEARHEISALVDTPTRIEARHETRCEEATSTSLHSKKKEARKIKPPHKERSTNPTYRSSYGSWISSKMYSCGSCFLWSSFLVKFW